MVDICPISGDANFDHLVKMISAAVPHYKVTFFPSAINNILWEISWNYENVLFLKCRTFTYLIISKTGK